MKKLLKTLVAMLAIAFAVPASAMQVYIHYDNGTWPTGISSTNFNTNGDLILEVEPSDSFEALKAKIEDKTDLNPDYIKLSYGTYDDLPNDGTLYAYGITSGGTTLTMTYNPPKYTANIAEGTEDATHWTITPATARIIGIVAGSELTATYSGNRKVESVKAVKGADVLPVTPLTIEALTDGTIVVSSPKNGMRYSKNGGAKTTSGISSITVVAGDRVSFYGNGTSITSYQGTKFTDGTAWVKVYGNIMSLVDENNFANATTLSAVNAFRALFQNYYKLKDASGLLLPATTLTNYCYAQMFLNCTDMENGPAELPATTLDTNCYSAMFGNCPKLTASPVLPATTLVKSCYYQMFSNCSNLKSVVCLATSGMDENSTTTNWLYSAGPEGTKIFKADPNANWPDGVNGIPDGWTRMDGTPDSWTEGTVYTSGNIDLRTLQVGDILKEGVTLNTNTNSLDQMYLNKNRYAVDGTTAYWGTQNLSTLVVGENGLFSDFGQNFTPINENGADGNAWVVISIVDQSEFGSDWREVYVSGISHLPFIPSSDNTVWTLASTPSYNIELQVNYLPQHMLKQIPADWTVTADGQAVSVTNSEASISETATVVLTPDHPERVKSVTLLDDIQTITIGGVTINVTDCTTWEQIISLNPGVVGTNLDYEVTVNGQVVKDINNENVAKIDPYVPGWNYHF